MKVSYCALISAILARLIAHAGSLIGMELPEVYVAFIGRARAHSFNKRVDKKRPDLTCALGDRHYKKRKGNVVW
jgi:hypothetical protein